MKFLLLMSFIVLSGQAYAQNMAKTEDASKVYKELPDGSSKYIGKCSTHEDYEKKYFKNSKTIQKYLDPSDLSDADIVKFLAKFDKESISLVFKTFDLYDLGDKKETETEILKNYVDDLEVKKIVHTLQPKLDLIQFNVGVGGGNGGYVVLNKLKTSAKMTYELLSFTFDNELVYCDKKVWLK